MREMGTKFKVWGYLLCLRVGYLLSTFFPTNLTVASGVGVETNSN
jgi:hypothetical protein